MSIWCVTCARPHPSSEAHDSPTPDPQDEAADEPMPPYPYFWRTAVQREKTRWHKLACRIEGELLPNLRGWKQRFKSTRGVISVQAKRIKALETENASLLKRATEAEAMVELLEGEVKAAETRAGMDNVREQFESQLKAEQDYSAALLKRAEAAERERDEARTQKQPAHLVALALEIFEDAKPCTPEERTKLKNAMVKFLEKRR